MACLSMGFKVKFIMTSSKHLQKTLDNLQNILKTSSVALRMAVDNTDVDWRTALGVGNDRTDAKLQALFKECDTDG